MRINRFGPSGVNPYKQQMNKLDAIDKPNNKKTDKVEISSEAKELQNMTSIEKERQMKVEELRAKVENGTYQIQPQEIAKSLVNYYKK